MSIENKIVLGMVALLAIVWLAGCVYIPKPDDSWLGEAYNKTVRTDERKH